VKKRDLMTDLKSIQEGRTLFDDPDPSIGTKYELYEVAEHAIERAIKAEKALGNETLLNGKALAKLNERADKAEALARELVEALEVEISLRGEDITYHRRSDECSICTRMLQNNKVLAKAKEVLGDE